MKTGVYEIINLINGKSYIGASNDVKRRWHEHRKKLRGNYHSNKYLQSSWNKYGEKNFGFFICELTLTPYEKELEYLEKVSPEYNIYYKRYPFPFTKKENLEKIRGSNNCNAKLNKDQVKEIKNELVKNVKTQGEIADEYNVSNDVISSIATGKSWNYVKVDGETQHESLPKNDREERKSNPHNAKLKETEVKEIKKELENGNKTQKSIAQKYSVAITTISAIARGKTWKNV